MTGRLHFHFSLSCMGEGNGNPLQCSCLENPRDGWAWWAAVYGITQSQTWLKWLSSSSSNSVYKLSKQGDNIQPWHTPFSIWNQFCVPCLVLSVRSWPASNFFRSQVRWSGSPISLRIFHCFLWSAQSKALTWSMKQNQLFFWNSLAFSMMQRVLPIWSLVPLQFLNPAWTSGSSRFTYWLKPTLENFQHYFANVWNECNCAVVWTFFGTTIPWDWNENWLLQFCGHCWVFQICRHTECSTLIGHLLGFEIA